MSNPVRNIYCFSLLNTPEISQMIKTFQLQCSLSLFRKLICTQEVFVNLTFPFGVFSVNSSVSWVKINYICLSPGNIQ